MNNNKNSDLSNCQNAFKEFIESGRESDLAKQLVSKGRITIDTGLNIYLNNYIKTLTQVLVDTFPATQKIIGEEGFEKLSRHYVKSHPAKNSKLAEYGDQFPNYLKGVEFSEAMPFLPNLADYEWVLKSVLLAPYGPVLDKIEQADDVTPQFLKRRQVLAFQSFFSVPELWASLINEDDVSFHDGESNYFLIRTVDGVRTIRMG